MQTLEFQDKTDLALSQRFLLALANSDFAEEITAVDLSDHFNLQVQISDKYTVLLGNEKDFEKKISRTEHALDYLSESMYALTGILHAERDVPVTFEFTGTIG
jgi:hypothetical protein